MAEARSAMTLGCIAPRMGRVDVPGRLAVLPRVGASTRLSARPQPCAGARMHAPVRFVAPLRVDDAADGRVVGARLQDGERVREVLAPWLVLASGAQPQATLAVGPVRAPHAGRNRAARLRQERGDEARASRASRSSGTGASSPGYGWIFPCGDDVFNIGVGVAAEPPRTARTAGTRCRTSTCATVFAAFQRALRAGARARATAAPGSPTPARS